MEWIKFVLLKNFNYFSDLLNYVIKKTKRSKESWTKLEGRWIIKEMVLIQLLFFVFKDMERANSKYIRKETSMSIKSKSQSHDFLTLMHCIYHDFDRITSIIDRINTLWEENVPHLIASVSQLNKIDNEEHVVDDIIKLGDKLNLYPYDWGSNLGASGMQKNKERHIKTMKYIYDPLIKKRWYKTSFHRPIRIEKFSFTAAEEELISIELSNGRWWIFSPFAISISWKSEYDNHLSYDVLSSWEKSLTMRFANILTKLKKNKLNILLIDEPESHLHFEWQRKYLDYAVSLLVQKKYKNYRFQIIMWTHSPLIISGMTNNNIIRLRRNGDAVGRDLIEDQTFGDTIPDILRDELYLKSSIPVIVEHMLNKLSSKSVANKTKTEMLDLIWDPYLKQYFYYFWKK